MKKILASLLVCATCLAEPTPTPSPSQQIAQPRTQWLILASTDTAQQPGANPATTYFISKNRVTLRQLPDGSVLITFEP